MKLLFFRKGSTDLLRKFTVEERSDGMFISTEWDTYECLQVDRDVKEFETYSAALAFMFEAAMSFAVISSDLDFKREIND